MKTYIFSIVLLFVIIKSNSQFLEKRGLSPDGTVFDMEQKDNILYVGGSFDRVGYWCGGIAKLNNDDVEPDFEFPFIKGNVYDIISDGAGGWYIGGEFDRAGNINRTNLVHVLSDMEIDLDFNPNINKEVQCLALINDTLFFGGWFTMVDGQARNYLAAYDVSSNSLTSFNPSPNLLVSDIEIYNGDLLLAGMFANVGDSASRGLARINAATGAVQSFPHLTNSWANDLFLDGDVLYVAGTFSGGAMSVNLQSNTVTDWKPNISGSIFGINVNTILKVESTIFVGGSFSKIGGESRKNMGAVDLSGNVLDFAPNPEAEVFSLFQHKNQIYSGGDFLTFDGRDLPHIARFNVNGDIDETWRLNPSWTVLAYFSSPDFLLAGGGFDMLSMHERNGVFAMDLTTKELLDWNPEGNFLTVSDLKVDELRDVVYLAGWDSKTSQHFKAFDGTTGDKLAGWEFVFNGAVNSIDQNNETGNIYVGGNFTTINGETRNKIAGIDPSGNLLSFNTSPNDDVRLLVASEEHNLLYFSGNFDKVNDADRLKTAAVDFNGQLSTWDPMLSHLVPSAIYLSEILPMDDRVFLSGNFSTIHGEERNRIGAVDPITGDVLSWNANVIPVDVLKGSVDLMEEFNNTLLIRGTNITDIAGQSFSALVLLGIQSAQVVDFIPYFGIDNGQPTHCVETLDSAIFLGGSFEILEENYHPFFATYIFPADDQPVSNMKIDKYSPKEGGNTGDVTIEFLGAGFKDGMEIILTKEGMPDINAVANSTFIHDEVRLSATFNLLDEDPGFRDIIIVQKLINDTLLWLKDAFEIKQGSGPNPWSELITPKFITKGAEEYFYLSYGNSGDTDAHGVPIWLTFSPNIEVLEIGFDIIRAMQPSDAYYDSIPEFVMIDSLLGEPYEAKVYGFIIPKIPAGSSFMVTLKIWGTSTGGFYSRSWVDRPMFGSPLKYYAGECFDAIFLKVVGFVPFGGCVTGVLDAIVSPFTDYAWDPEFGSAAWTMSYLEVLVSAALECGGDAITGGVAGVAKHAIEALLDAKSIYDLIQKCSEPEDKDDNTGEFVASCDPNDKNGPVGQGDEGWLNTKKTFPYMVRFENRPDATAPAKQVTIKDTLDLNVFDLSTLQLKGFTIADSVYKIQSGKVNFSTIVDIRPRLPYFVKLEVSVDSISGLLSMDIYNARCL